MENIRKLTRMLLLFLVACPSWAWAAGPEAEPPGLTAEIQAQLDQADDLRDDALRLENKRELRESLSSGRQSLEIYREVLGARDPVTARSLDLVWRLDLQVAILCLQSQDFDAARTCLEEARTIGQARFGACHPHMAELFVAMAQACGNKQEFSAAKLLLEQSLATYRQTDNQKHATGIALGMLGEACHKLGDSKSAKDFFEQSLALLEVDPGEEHLHTAKALDCLGGILFEQSDHAAARRYLERALAIRKKLLGETHMQTAQSLISLGAPLYLLGEQSAARGNFEQAREIGKELHGESSSQYAGMLDALGCLLHRLGDYAMARSCLEQSLAIRREALEQKHPAIAESLTHLASLLEHLEETSIAQACLQEALKIEQECLGTLDPRYTQTLIDYGRLLYNSTDYAAAKSCFEQALANQRALLGERHRDCVYTLKWLGCVLIARNQPLLSQSCYEQALDIERAALGEKHPDYIASLVHVGRLCDSNGDAATARSYLEQALAIRATSLGESDPDTIAVRGYLDKIGQTPTHDYFAPPTDAAAKPVATDATAVEAAGAKWEVRLMSTDQAFIRTPTQTSQASATESSTNVVSVVHEDVHGGEQRRSQPFLIESPGSSREAPKPIEVDILALRRAVAEERRSKWWWRNFPGSTPVVEDAPAPQGAVAELPRAETPVAAGAERAPLRSASEAAPRYGAVVRQPTVVRRNRRPWRLFGDDWSDVDRRSRLRSASRFAEVASRARRQR